MRSTFKITFYVNKGKEKNGIVPVLGRITISGSIAQFSCKQSIDPKLWDAKSNRATGRSDQAVHVNRALDNIRAQITKHYQRISDRVSYVNAEMVRNAWPGIGTEYESLPSALDKHNEEFKKRAGKDRSRNTLDKYLIVRHHLADFIKSQYRRSDLHLKEITEDGGLPLAEIGQSIGIPSTSTFYRQFAAVTGMAPTEYRRKFGNGFLRWSKP